MTQAALLQWDEYLGTQGLQAIDTRLVPNVTNVSAGLLQVTSAQIDTFSSVCQGRRHMEQMLVPAVFVSPGMIPLSHLEQLQGHMSLLDTGMAAVKIYSFMGGSLHWNFT